MLTIGATGTLDRGSGQGYVDVEAQLVSFNDSGDIEILDFDAEGVTIKHKEGPCSNLPGNVEAVGPDYDGYWYLDSSQFPPVQRRVLFTDSPCVRRWAKLKIENSTESNSCSTLVNTHSNTPISGPYGGQYLSFMSEAVYVIDVEVESGAVLRTGTPDADAVNLNIYYTGSARVGGSYGSVVCKDGTTNCGPAPIHLTPTRYGNFDGDSTTGSDQDDIDFFEDAYCTTIGENNGEACGGENQPACKYNPLVDWNCDGKINCLDRQFMLNYPGSELSEDNCTAYNPEACP